MPKATIIPRQGGYVLLDNMQSNGQASIEVGSPAWFAWLQDNRAFSFGDDAGQFNALKERVREKGWYWKAYHWENGRRRSVYLGRSEDLSPERLEETVKRIHHTETTSADKTVQRIPRTKVFVPALRPARVVRQRLLQRVRSGAQLPITVVVAPAGYGKTTLIADWIRTDKRDTAWLSLDAGDNAPVQFWASLGAALDAFQLGASQSIQAELRTPQMRPNPAAIMADLVNDFTSRLHLDARGRPRIFVIDDLHMLTNPELLQAVTYFADHLPPTLHLLITTRSETDLPMARWRVQHRVSELRAAELAFNDLETRAFLAGTMGVKLGEEAVAVLEARTEGWVAALQLAALSLQSHADPAVFIGQFRGNQQHVMSYLVDQVLARLPLPVLDFITRAAVLDRMCDDLCRALLDDTTIAGIPTLDDLYQANLFVVALDDEQRWFRFHHLFVDLLRARLNENEPGLAQQLHRRASQWFENAGDVQASIQHAVLARDFARAAQLVDDDISHHWLHQGMNCPSESWVEQLPDEDIHRHPALMLARAAIHLRQLQVSVAHAWLDALEYTLNHAPRNDADEIMLGRLLMLRSYAMRIQQVDAIQVLHLSEQAIARISERDFIWRANALLTHASLLTSSFNDSRRAFVYINEAGELALRHNNRETHIGSLYLGALNLCYSGLLRRADAMLAHANRLLKAWKMPDAASRSWRDNVTLRLVYERNDLQTVDDIAQPMLERAVVGADHIALVNAAMHLVHAHMARGAYVDAMRVIHVAEPVCASSPLSRQYIAALHAFLAAARGDTTLLEAWVDDVMPKVDNHSGMRIPGVHVDLRIYLARACMMLEDLKKSRLLLDAYIAQVQETQACDTLIRCLTLRALVHERNGARAEALDDLRDALALGRPEGYLRVFVDEGPAMHNLLLAARAKNIEPAYVMKLLDAFNLKQAVPVPAMPHVENVQWVESISSREQQVLVMLAAGHSNQSIADALGVTLTTVKSHAGSIYTKLGVKSRTQAIARAREMGLLGNS